MVSLSKGTYWQISNIVIKFVLTAFLYLDPCCLNPTVNVVLNWHLTCFSKYGRENQIGARIRSCILPTLAHWETLWQTEREPSEYIQTSAQVFLKHLEANFKNLDRMELMSDLTLQFFLSLNNDLFFFSFQALAVRFSVYKKLNRLIRPACLDFQDRNKYLT